MEPDDGRNVLQRVGNAAGFVWHGAAGIHTHGVVGLRYAPAPHPRTHGPAKTQTPERASIPRLTAPDVHPSVPAGGGATTLTVNNVVLKPDPVCRPALLSLVW